MPTSAWAQFPPELRGRVVAGDAALPLGAARVEVEDGSGAVRTDADGRFAIRGLAPGTHALRVTALGHQPRREFVALENGQVTTVTIALIPTPLVLAAVDVTARPELPGTTPASALVLDRDAIDASGTTSLGALLDGRAGLLVTSRGGPGSPTTLSVRGGAADQLLVLLDGVEVNQPVTGEADLSTIPLASIERVTLLRGAQAARYGSRALAGVLLIETRRTSQDQLAITVDGGTLGERALGATGGRRLAFRSGSLVASGSAESREVDGAFRYDVPLVRGGGTGRRANASSRVRAAVGSLRHEWAGLTTGVRGELLDVRRGMPGTVVQPSATADQDQQRTGAGAFLRLVQHTWDVALDAGVQTQRASYRDPAPPFGMAYDDSVDVRAASAAVSVQTTRDRFALGTGFDARDTRIDASTLATDAPILVRQAGGWTTACVWRDIGGVGAGARRAPRVRAELFGGLRADRTTLLDDVQVMPRVGGSLGGGGVTARLSWGRAFSPPGLADQFFQEGVQVRPNPDLRPERIDSEIEVSLELRDRALGPLVIGAELSAYRADVRDMILWFPDFLFVWSPANQDARRRGWDLNATASLPSSGVDVHGAVTYVDVAYAGPVLRGQIVYRPRLGFSVGSAMTIGAMRVRLDVRHVGERRVAPGSPLNALSAYTTADLRTSRSFALDRWTLDVGAAIDNVLDRRISLLADYPQPGRRLTTSLRIHRGSAVRPSAGTTTATSPSFSSF